MKVLVLSAAYPKNDGSVAMYYVHARNCYYLQEGIEVNVLNFSAREEYIIDGIKVFGLKQYEESFRNVKYDILILHAANIKYHYKFIKNYGQLFPQFLFFFHGHEVLRCSKVYSKPYDYVKTENSIYKMAKDCYDIFKLKFWKKQFVKYLDKSWFVFVSNWMFDEFQKWVGLNTCDLKDQYSTIYNCVGQAFETESYHADDNKKYDYVSIRSDFDGSKYGVDIVCRLAEENPDKKFYLLGKGEYFKHRKKPDNLLVEQMYLNHQKVMEILNESRCALMPTRTDAQGVMACEMATFGIPLITSDIAVCREVFQDFDNVGYISNETKNIPLEQIYQEIAKKKRMEKNKKYFSCNTSGKEVELLKQLYKKKGEENERTVIKEN